jgi:hypothetical protein
MTFVRDLADLDLPEDFDFGLLEDLDFGLLEGLDFGLLEGLDFGLLEGLDLLEGMDFSFQCAVAIFAFLIIYAVVVRFLTID